MPNSVDFDKMETKLKEILEKEKTAFKLTEEQFKDFLLFMAQVCRSYTKIVEHEGVKEEIVDLDAHIEKVFKEEKAEAKYGNSIPVNFFLQNGFNEVLDVEPSYYKLRDELLRHSKRLKEDPQNIDYLIWEPVSVTQA